MYLSKPIEFIILGVQPNVSCELWVIMMYQYRFISCKKYATLVEVLTVGETVH